MKIPYVILEDGQCSFCGEKKMIQLNTEHTVFYMNPNGNTLASDNVIKSSIACVVCEKDSDVHESTPDGIRLKNTGMDDLIKQNNIKKLFKNPFSK